MLLEPSHRVGSIPDNELLHCGAVLFVRGNYCLVNGTLGQFILLVGTRTVICVYMFTDSVQLPILIVLIHFAHHILYADVNLSELVLVNTVSYMSINTCLSKNISFKVSLAFKNMDFFVVFYNCI